MRTDNPTGIGRLTTIALWIFLVLVLAKAAADLNTIRVLGGLGDAVALPPVLRSADAITAGMSLLYSLGYMVTSIAVLRWIYVTNRNAQAWSAHVSVTPGWNVSWFFVPVANLFKPFEGVRETYQASVDPEEPAIVPVPPVMRIWWGALLVGSLTGNFIFWLQRSATSIANVIAARWWETALAVVIVVQTLTLLAIVRRTTAAQVARWAD